MCGAVCSTSREESCRRMHMGSWGRVLRYDRIRSRHIEWITHRGAKGLVRLMILLINTPDNVLSTDHIHVPCTLLFAHVAHHSREDIHVHVQSEGEEAGGVVADHSKGQDTRQSTIAIQTEVDEDAITVSWQVPRHNDVGEAHILHRHSIKSIRCWGKEGEEDDIT